MLTGLKITALDKQTNSSETTVPKLPFSCLINAGKGLGKSTLLVNMLINKDILGNKFNQIYFISPTAVLDSKIDLLKNTPGIIKVNKPLIKLLSKKSKIKILDYGLTRPNDVGVRSLGVSPTPNYDTKIPEENFIDDVSGDLLKEIIAEQKSIIQKYGKSVADEILLIYDDTVSAKKFWNSQSVLKMLLNSRHYKISIIITSQSYKLIPKNLRLNMSLLILFFTANMKELQSIYEENSSSIGWKKFEEIFVDTTEKKAYNFLTINYQSKPQARLQSGFENVIDLKL